MVDSDNDQNGQAKDETALAGKDGHELNRLIQHAKAAGVKVFNNVMQTAIRHYTGKGPVLSRLQLHQIAGSLATVNTTANLMGRTRTREIADRANEKEGISKFDNETPLSSFPTLADDVSLIATPQQAVDYFTSLVPSLGVDPFRFASEQLRKAFTLAASSNEVLTAKVQEAIAEGLKYNLGTNKVTQRIADLLNSAGVAPKNPQYSEMVFRTNAADAYQTGMYEEGRHPDVSHVFPAWQYLGIRDGRQGKDHEIHFDKYYPSSAAFASVRGNRPYNCRCSLAWIDAYDWQDLQNQGVKLETDW